MKGQTIGAAVTAISIAVIVAAILLIPISDTSGRATLPQSITNESVTCADNSSWIAGTSNATLTYDNVVPGTETVTNDTASLTSGTEYYLYNTSGIVAFSQCNSSVGSAENGTWNVTYQYYDDIYQSNSLDRTITGYIPVVVAATIIAATAAAIKVMA